jgi:hypothetical protein
MMMLNRGLHTIDLKNTGLLDEGVAGLAHGARTAPAEHRQLAVDTLYLDANALTIKSIDSLEALFNIANHGVELSRLSISENRLGDEGVLALVNQLVAGPVSPLATLTMLNIGSNGLTSACLPTLVDALLEHCPKLKALCLGSYKSTKALSEICNAFDEEALAPLKRLLQNHKSLQLINLSFCGLNERQMLDLIETSLGEHQSLEGAASDYGVRHSKEQRRVWLHGENVVHIDSVYRGM